jgi:uncharacterized protein with FMN-binding domain
VTRTLPALGATVVGVIALVSFKSSPGLPKSSSALHAKGTGAVAAGRPPAGATTTAPPATSPPTTSPTTTSKPTASTPTTNAPTTNAPTVTTPTTSAGAVRTIDGDPSDNQYGTVQVEVTLQGGRITGITELQMPQDRQHSAEISQAAAPILEQEVLQAQSAQIDIVSGATFTSQSYAQSLQSALDKASR